MEISIVKGTAPDAEVIAGFQLAMAEESEGTVLNLETVRRGVSAVLSDPAKGMYFVARNEDGTIMGSLLVTKEWSDWNDCDYWWIQSVYVRPEFRHQGVFKALYSEVRAQAQQAGSTYLRLYVDKENSPAQNTYRKLGMGECHYLMFEEKL